MSFLTLLSAAIILTFCHCSLILAQQPYEGQSFTDCQNPSTYSKSVLGYTCNGLNKTCQSYLTFRSQPPYNTVSAISGMLASDPSQLAEINSVSESATFETNKLVIVPVNCSCSGDVYQLNTSHVVDHGDTFLIIANNTFQGLSTCQAILNQNSNLTTKNLYSGTRLGVPLRCACPTRNQTDVGTNYLLSYIVAKGDYVSKISNRFHADTGITLEANGLSEQSTIYPFSTLLVPLQNPPSSFDTIEPPSLSPPSIPAPPPKYSSNHSKNKWVYALIGALAGGASVLVVGIFIFCAFFRTSAKKETDSVIFSESLEALEKPPEKEVVEEESQDFVEAISGIAQSLKVYKFEDLQRATDDFSSTCLIKGSVYRGKIDGDLAAIKQMNGDVSKEINLLNKINHSNLIRLSGVCFNDGHCYVIYEYAVNGPLSDWIYYSNNDGEKFLTWTQRIQILLDVASGLNYLHSFTTPPHVHKDVKSSNILLDSDFRAKIANFGLARSTDAPEGEFYLTNHIVGTIGYMAPEYLENGLISTKLDVYAFGALMLEILTGKEVAVFYEGNTHLSDVLSSVLNDEDEQQNLRHFMDPSMQERYPPELAMFVIRLIDNCLKKNPAARPAMEVMVQFLSRTMSNSLSWELTGNISG